MPLLLVMEYDRFISIAMNFKETGIPKLDYALYFTNTFPAGVICDRLLPNMKGQISCDFEA